MTPPLRRNLSGLAVEHHLPESPDGRPDDAPVIVVVHGAMDRAAGFRRAVRHLRHREVVAYDRRGYGDSIALGVSDDLYVHAVDLAAVCRSVPGPVLVVGHSQGGLIALTAAARGRVEGLVGLVVWEAPTPAERDDNGSADFLHWADDPGEVAERFLRTMIGARLWDRVPERTKVERRAEGPALVADLRSSRRPDAVPDLTAVHVPVVVGRGATSSQHHRRAAASVANGVPIGRLDDLPEVGHGPHLSAPRTFAHFVLDAEAWILARAGSGAPGGT